MSATSFDALIAAYEPGPGPGGLRALVPLAGRPLVEHQLRRAVAAGAGRLLLLVDALPPELAEVVTLLKRDGLDLMPVAGLDLASEALGPNRACLLVADACLVEETVLRRLSTRTPPTLATLPDQTASERHERIDADTRWAGVALLDGERVATAAAMLGSWDPVSTLLRRAVQEGADRLDVGEDAPVLLLDPSEVAQADLAIVAAARPRANDWVERWLHAPLLRLAMPTLVERGTPPEALAWPASAAMLLAGVLAVAGWRWVPLVLLLLGQPLLAAGRQLARVADRPLVAGWALGRMVAGGFALAGIGLGMGLAGATGQWGWLLCAALLVGAALLVEQARPLARPFAPAWLARCGPLAWALLPFAVANRWDWGLAALAFYAGVSLGLLYRAVLRLAAAEAGVAVPRLV